MEDELIEANLDASTEEAFLAAKATEESPEAEVQAEAEVEAEKPAEEVATVAEQEERAAELESAYPELVARLKESGVSESEMLAAIDAEAEKIAQSATVKTLETRTAQVKAEILEQVKSGELSEAAAKRLWEAEWQAAAVALENEQLRQSVAQSASEKAVERVQAEFPNTPLASLRKLAQRGLSESELKEFAAEQESAVQAAIAKQAAAKAEDGRRAHVPARGTPGRSGVKTVDHSDSFEDIFASRKG